MKRLMGFLLCSLVFFSCSSSPGAIDSNYMAYRPAFLIGDQVFVLGGEYAQSVGTILEVNMEAGVYRVQLNNRANPVLIRASLLRKYEGRITPQMPPHENTPYYVQQEPPPAERNPGRLAVLPIIGLDEYIGETLAWHLANEEIIHSNYNVVPITPTIRKNLITEGSYSAVYDAGEDVNADYIMASFARKIGYQKIFLIVVLDVKTKQQLAGDFRKYFEVQDIQEFLPSMAKKIMTVVQNKKKDAPKLSVELMAIPPNSSLKSDAAVLTQILAITAANTNTYAVFPRNDSIDAAMLDYETRRTSAKKIFVNKDDVTPSDFLLSAKIDTFDAKNQIIAEIVDVDNNVLRKGAYIDFQIIEDVPELLGRLSANITSDIRKN